MPALSFLAVVGAALIGLMFLANATLEPVSPPITTSQRSGLPEAQRFNAAQTLSVVPAPAPDMTSQAVLAAQPKSQAKSAADDGAKIGPAALATQAEAPTRNKRVVRSRGYKQSAQFSKFSIKGY
jgi:hypothetical protein